MCFSFHWIFPITYHKYNKKKKLIQKVEYSYREKTIHNYYPNGNIKATIRFRGNNLHGECLKYFENGGIQKFVNFNNNKRYGLMYENFITKDGIKPRKTGYFQHGLKHGPFLYYNETGNIIYLENYVQEKRHGDNIIYHPNGEKKLERTFQYGTLTGNQYIFDENGNVLSQKYFLGGKEIFHNVQNLDIEECSVCFEDTNFKTVCKHPICIHCKKKLILCPICRRHLL